MATDNQAKDMKNRAGLFLHTDDLTETIQKAVNNALLQHQAMGNKIAFWDKGKIVIEVPGNVQKLQMEKTSRQNHD